MTYYFRSNRDGRLDNAGSRRSKWLVVASYSRHPTRTSTISTPTTHPEYQPPPHLQPLRQVHNEFEQSRATDPRLTNNNPSLSSNPSTSFKKNALFPSVMRLSRSSKTRRQGEDCRAFWKIWRMPVREGGERSECSRGGRRGRERERRGQFGGVGCAMGGW